MAHRGEALSFLKQDKLKSIDKNLYQGQDYLLLLTKEGPDEVMIRLPYYLAKFPEITEIINLGIAGGLSKILKLNDIIEIRTVYGHNHKPLFHSYTLNEEAKFDCITSYIRSNSEVIKEKLSHFAHTVDRELWAMAKVCKEYNLKLKSFKLISDMASNDVFCENIKEKAEIYSEQIYNFVHKNNILKAHKENQSLTIENLPFRASFTLKKRIEKLTQKSDFSQANQIINSSKNAQECILRLENKLNPLKPVIENHINKLKEPFENIGAKLEFDPKLEKKMATIKMDINSQENINHLNRVLTKFNYDQVNKLWSGDFDV